MMTSKHVRDRVREIAESSRDDSELSHAAEDWLWMEVLAAIATGECADPRECAKAALETRQIEFERVCA